MKRVPTVRLSPPTPSSTGKRVRFDASAISGDDDDNPAPKTKRRGGRGFELWRVGVDGKPIDAKPRVACDVDTRVLELGRTSFVNEYDVGKHITRVSRVHFRIHQGEQHEGHDDDSPMYRLEDLASNSTYVNGEKVGKGKTRVLEHNDIITVLFDENGGPLLQYRFVVLRDDNDEEDEEEGKDGNLNHMIEDEDDMAVATLTASTTAVEPVAPVENGNWLARNAVSISAAVVLLGSAVAANMIHF